MSEEEKFTNNTKIIFRDSEYYKAQLKLKLEYDNLTQSKFFKSCVRAYINDDPSFKKWIEELLEKEKKLRPHEKCARKQIEKEVEGVVANFNLEDKEVDGIFDLLEEDFPDL